MKIFNCFKKVGFNTGDLVYVPKKKVYGIIMHKSKTEGKFEDGSPDIFFEYTLLIKNYGEQSWYNENQLKLLKRNKCNLIPVWEESIRKKYCKILQKEKI